jgi:hypothetical protein
LNRRQQHGNQNSDDRDDYQEFNERKTTVFSHEIILQKIPRIDFSHATLERYDQRGAEGKSDWCITISMKRTNEEKVTRLKSAQWRHPKRAGDGIVSFKTFASSA